MKIESKLAADGLFLRSLNDGDVTTRYLNWLSDPDVTRHLEVRFSAPSTLEDLASFVADVNRSADNLMLGIFLQSNGSHIGNIKLGPINSYHRSAEIGLLIGERSEWGKGYASSAIKSLADFAFFTLGIFKLTACCYASNQGSLRAFLKAGFFEEGRRVLQYEADGSREDGVLLGKVIQNLSQWSEK
jgi:ribosomal-protein-alanine N-acetyltransferase